MEVDRGRCTPATISLPWQFARLAPEISPAHIESVMRAKPLWAAVDQQERLLELTAGTKDRRKELPLRRDVRSLGIQLGEVIVAQCGQELFDTVVKLRQTL